MPVESKIEEAISWRIRLSDPAASADQWAEFSDWLEVDPANADAYDAIALADDDLSETIAIAKSDRQLPQNDNAPVPVKLYRRRGMQAIAASVAVALLASPMLFLGRDLQTYETQLGETREITLSDGSQIAMNGGTVLRLDSKSNRFVRLESGEAVFVIRHDASNPFVVETGDATLQDVGTVFNVRQDGSSLEVSVADGAVRYNPKAEAVTVAAGNKLQVSKARPVPVISKADPKTVAGWRQGQLSYEEATLSAIAVDLSRAIGDKVAVSGNLGSRRFTGVIRLEKDRKLLFRRLEGLLGVRAQHSASGWLLTS
ncbi:FecR family protein [Sphingorhabdus sp.]|uniref:FecR family protein n=1 Tax=Sphingorhabdus sp. TaxID=1902408 RepID=UPI0039832EF5